MLEVYTGHKPGRPVLLVTISALALVGALGGAWLQVQNRRALAPAVRLEGTPLMVRAPRGWVPNPKDLHSFILPAKYTVWGKDVRVAEREITFIYQRLPYFQSPAASLAAEFRMRFGPGALTPARIGPLEGVQFVRTKQGRRDGRRTGDVIVRRACSPRGDQITVLYLPLTELSQADLGLLEDVCAAVKIDDPSVNPPAEAALRQAGFALTPANDWTVSGPDFAEVAGLYLGGGVEGLPVWALRLNRTFLDAGRTPRDLLIDLAAAHWKLPVAALRISESQRADGASVTTMRPASAQFASPLAGATVVVHNEDAAIIFTHAEGNDVEAADVAAQQVAANLSFIPTVAAPDVAAAAEAGRDLAARLARPEALAGAWGMLPERAFFKDSSAAGGGVIASGRAARNRRPQEGFYGFSLQLFNEREYAAQWQIDADGATFESSREGYDGFAQDSTPVRTTERRRRGESTITRTRTVGREVATSTFEVGRGFVCLPAEEIAEEWVAGQEGGAWLLSVTSADGGGPHGRLLTPLSPDENGLRRVLLQDDYDPSGTVEAFDADGRLQYVLQPGWRAERVSAEEAQRDYPDLGRLIRKRFE